MTDKQKEIVKELKEANLDFTGWYGPSCYETGLSDLTEDTPENAVYFTLHRNNVYDCEADCGERTAYDFYGEEYTYNACGEEGECDAIWEEDVCINTDGTIKYNDETYNNIYDFLNAI